MRVGTCEGVCVRVGTCEGVCVSVGVGLCVCVVFECVCAGVCACRCVCEWNYDAIAMRTSFGVGMLWQSYQWPNIRRL